MRKSCVQTPAVEDVTVLEESIFNPSIAEYGKVALTVIGGIPGKDMGVVTETTWAAKYEKWSKSAQKSYYSQQHSIIILYHSCQGLGITH